MLTTTVSASYQNPCADGIELTTSLAKICEPRRTMWVTASWNRPSWMLDDEARRTITCWGKSVLSGYINPRCWQKTATRVSSPEPYWKGPILYQAHCNRSSSLPLRARQIGISSEGDSEGRWSIPGPKARGYRQSALYPSIYGRYATHVSNCAYGSSTEMTRATIMNR